MIWLDVTKTADARHKSGLTRVTTRLAEELGGAARRHGWPRRGGWKGEGERSDWYVTAEVFAPAERPGFERLLHDRPLGLAAIFHDAIPLELPDVTWPQAVARHPAYLSMLADFDRVFAVSEASREKLLGFWRWQGRAARARVEVIALGADFARGADQAEQGQAGSRAQHEREGRPALLCVGILEPRKRQDFLVGVAEALWREGLDFNLGFAGRVNPHFGKPILKRIKASRARYLGAVGDDELARLYRGAIACLFPTSAEGCGLPLLEALGLGTPCVASDIPALRENAGGGCVLVGCDDAQAWIETLRLLLTAASTRDALRAQAESRSSSLPRWAGTARALQSFLSA
ncbi:MAG TPA: glycosyltransferase [Opitutaceae bacterium]|jgi:glycosyltransferase involved in cell wall biosynthesis|nr:glycosyltransferase [Opitutaceae bacterium]